MRKAQKDQRVHVGNLNSAIEDSLLGIRVVKSFAKEDLEKAALNVDNVKRQLEGQEVIKIIVVPNKIVNIVAKAAAA